MRLLKFPVLFGVWMLACVNFCWAESATDPIQMLQGVTTQVLNELRENHDTLKNNSSELYKLVNRFIVPHADFVEMAKWVVGRNAWQAADASTQQAFVEEFKTLVVRSYAGALLGYTDQRVEFLPLRTSTNKERIQVSTLVKDGVKKPLRMDYRVLKFGNGWKIYDIIIEGVSLMQGYRAQFATEAKEGGLKAVINQIRKHNQSRGSS